MKKLTIVLALLLVALTSSLASASDSDFKDGDYNYPYVSGMSTGNVWYLNIRSMAIEKYEPPYYVLSADIIRTFWPGRLDEPQYTVLSTERYRFFYNYNDRKMYVDVGKPGQENWKYLDPTHWFHENEYVGRMGESVWYMAYRMKFYGDREYPDQNYQNEMVNVIMPRQYEVLNEAIRHIK